jgi:hypothetical protein
MAALIFGGLKVKPAPDRARTRFNVDAPTAKLRDGNQNLVTYHTKSCDAIENLRKRKIAGVFAADESLRVESPPERCCVSNKNRAGAASARDVA